MSSNNDKLQMFTEQVEDLARELDIDAYTLGAIIKTSKTGCDSANRLYSKNPNSSDSMEAFVALFGRILKTFESVPNCADALLAGAKEAARQITRNTTKLH